jgi:Domain of unknown function (DUF4160)
MSPTIFRERGFRFSFFSNEEPRMHVHVSHADGRAKFWLEPDLELAENNGLKPGQIKRAFALIKEHENEIKNRWETYFRR